jgi:hypothetical protein
MFSKMPKVNSTAMTPDGQGVVVFNDILREQVKVRIENADGGVEVRVYPLSKINCKSKQEIEDN